MRHQGRGDDVAQPAGGGGRVESRPAQSLALTDYRTAIRDMTRLNQLFAILGEPAPLEVLVDRVLIALSELFAADVVALLEPAGPGDLRPLGEIGLPEESAGTPFSSVEGTHAALAIRRRAAVLVPNALDDPRLDPQLRQLDVQTAAWLPVLGNQEVLAILLLARCEPVAFARPDADLLMAMTYRIGVVLERARADEERRRLEAQLALAEKAASLSRMAAAIAHHFNNKLTAVMGSLELALDDLATGRDPRTDIERAQDAARQAARVGQLMLAYLGQSVRARESLDLVAACRDALPDLVPKLPDAVRLRADLPERAITVRASVADVREILTNLIVNAAEAMPSGGEIRVSIRAVPAGQLLASPLVEHDWAATAGEYACLEVADTGHGMTANVLRNAFDPFFTTKFTGRGLGLSVVLGLARAHEGTVTATSEKGHGSTFGVYLPLRPPPIL